MKTAVLHMITAAFLNGEPHTLDEDRTVMRNIGECRNAMELATRNLPVNERYRKEKRLNSIVYFDDQRNNVFILSCTEQ